MSSWNAGNAACDVMLDLRIDCVEARLARSRSYYTAGGRRCQRLGCNGAAHLRLRAAATAESGPGGWAPGGAALRAGECQRPSAHGALHWEGGLLPMMS